MLHEAGYVLQCHNNRAHAVFYGEIGASLAILEAGYTIDSFLTRYQGVDWRDEANWQCNKAVSPIGKRTFDGVTLPAYEAVFPKVKGSLLESGVPSHYDAWKLSQWMSLPVRSLAAFAVAAALLHDRHGVVNMTPARLAHRVSERVAGSRDVLRCRLQTGT